MAVSPKDIPVERTDNNVIKDIEKYIDDYLLWGNFTRQGDMIIIPVPKKGCTAGIIQKLSPAYERAGWLRMDTYSDGIHSWIRLFI